jgi:hypothetical protein
MQENVTDLSCTKYGEAGSNDAAEEILNEFGNSIQKFHFNPLNI